MLQLLAQVGQGQNNRLQTYDLAVRGLGTLHTNTDTHLHKRLCCQADEGDFYRADSWIAAARLRKRRRKCKSDTMADLRIPRFGVGRRMYAVA